MDPKPFYLSKTLWVNLIAAAAGLVQQFWTGWIISPEEQGGILVVVNIILRIVTKQPISG